MPRKMAIKTWFCTVPGCKAHGLGSSRCQAFSVAKWKNHMLKHHTPADIEDYPVRIEKEVVPYVQK